MNFPFQINTDSLTRIQSVISDCHYPSNIPYDFHQPDIQKQPRVYSCHQEARDFRSLSYVLLQEALRKQLPGQAQLNAYDRLLDFELGNIVQEQGQPIEVYAINTLKNVSVKLYFVDISVDSPVHKERDGTHTYLFPSDVAKRRIPYDVHISVDMRLVQQMYEPVPPLKDFSDGKSFFAPCMIVQDVDAFNGWGLATGRGISQDPKTRLEKSQKLWFRPGVWDAFHEDLCKRQNRRSRIHTTVEQLKRQLWNPLNHSDQELWDEACEEPGAKGFACIKLLVFIGYRDNNMDCFVVQKMGKRTLFDSYGDVMATLPPYIEQCPELAIKSTTEYIYGIPFIKLPCMLGSRYCQTVKWGHRPRLDSGIIMTGSCDKVVILQQQLGNNQVFLFNQKAGQAIAEVRSAHIHKRRSTSAFRFILSPKSGPYILLPFLQKSTGSDLPVHIVDFIRLLWEYGGIYDPDIDFPMETIPTLLDCFHTLDSFESEENCIMWNGGIGFARKMVTSYIGSPQLTEQIMRLAQMETWKQYHERTKKVPTVTKTSSKAKKKLTKKAAKKRKTVNVYQNKEFRKSKAQQRIVRFFRSIVQLLGRRTIQSVDQVVSVLTLSFFGPQVSGPCMGSNVEKYFELKTMIREHTKQEQFQKSVGSILNYLAHEGARERTLAAQRMYVLNNVLRSELFPHLGTDADITTRRSKLFYTMNQIFQPLYDLYTGRSKCPTDKDSMGNKRIDLFDEIIGTCFRQQAQSNRGTLANYIQAEAESGIHVDSSLLNSLICNRRFENSLRYCFNTGRTRPSDKRPGGKSQNQNGSGGIQQVSGNSMARVSHVRRVRHAHINADNKAIGPREVHCKDLGKLCPGETPEGPLCGILKNLALLAHVSAGYVTTEQVCALLHCTVSPQWICTDKRWDCKHTIVINGVIKAFYFAPAIHKIVDRLRLARRAGNLHFEISIYVEGSTLFLDSRAGRTMTLYVVSQSLQDGHFFKVLNQNRRWESRNLVHAMLQSGCMEYLCTNEESTSWVAPTWSDWLAQLQAHTTQMYSHIMLHAVTMMDYAIASMIFPEANQGPRNTYQAKMLSQAVCLPDDISKTSMEKNKHHLNYGQAPLVQSMISCTPGILQFTSGLNVITAIMRWAYNMEDALVINQAAIDRGLFHMTYTYDLILEPEKSQQIEVPNYKTCRNIKQANYSKLDPKTGIIRVGSRIEHGDVLIGLTSTIADPISGRKIKIDVSMLYLKKIPGRIANITQTTNRYGDSLINLKIVATNKEVPFPTHLFKSPHSSSTSTVVRVHSTRPQGISVPTVGDKFASRSAQKGVIGLIVPEADLPFVAEGPNIGMKPEMIMSPDALPSRMTIGSPMLEMMLGVLGAVLGQQIDGTPFSTEHLNIDEVRKELEKVGQNGLIEHHMRCGCTGEIIAEGGKPLAITMGPVYYQRLAHFVVAKIHSRNGGPLNYFTRQPTQGRAKGGGGRFGTMETDALVGHGGTALVRERLLLASDDYRVPVCRLCGLMGETNRNLQPYCRSCGIPNTCVIVQMPYAAKTMMHLYQSAHLTCRMNIK